MIIKCWQSEVLQYILYNRPGINNCPPKTFTFTTLRIENIQKYPLLIEMKSSLPPPPPPSTHTHILHAVIRQTKLPRNDHKLLACEKANSYEEQRHKQVL